MVAQDVLQAMHVAALLKVFGSSNDGMTSRHAPGAQTARRHPNNLLWEIGRCALQLVALGCEGERRGRVARMRLSGPDGCIRPSHFSCIHSFVRVPRPVTAARPSKELTPSAQVLHLLMSPTTADWFGCRFCSPTLLAGTRS